MTVHNADAARRLLAEDKDKKIAGYLCYMVGIWTGAPQTIAEAGKPTLFVDDLYSGSGEFLIAYAAARRAGKNVAGVSSSRFDDVLTAARSFARIKDRGDGRPVRRRLHGRRAQDLQAGRRRDDRRRSTHPPSSTPTPP